ncbi:hypothetical protein BCR36DRAFT_582786 [Piromyces finnis]|uniref:Uncharacterized protein n=1 Tax=Piromyces finnis TaxID=1754191 RepID=A0A1Y1VB74_9FUNG|nr:hypothetical protein BCR36DRAFT_582786 [Piromyces finnis]|eukprot:ORX51743.1 hypothetical protein BCR36DRAFT_582786 [Piromyces finnis]
MAAVEPVCFYPNRKYINEFNQRQINTTKLADYLYQKENEKEEKEKDGILFKIKQPYLQPDYYNSTLVHTMPIITVLPTNCIHENTKQYKQYEIHHYEEPAWTKAEKELFNVLYKTIGKNFYKIAKEFENRATTIVLPSTILKHSKLNITTKETENNCLTNVTAVKPIALDTETAAVSTEENSFYGKTKKRKLTKDDKIGMKTTQDHSFNCQMIPSQNNNTLYLLVHNVDDIQPQTIEKESMIFPRTTSEIIHYYYKYKFNIPNWKDHKEVKNKLKKIK